MAEVARLITCVDVDDWPDQPDRQVSVSAVLKAELSDGREVVLLDDRGWSQTTFFAGEPAAPQQWISVTREDIEETARMVVGPDEPPDGGTDEDAAQMHWSLLAGTLAERGIVVSADDLRSLAHPVALTDRLLARIAG